MRVMTLWLVGLGFSGGLAALAALFLTIENQLTAVLWAGNVWWRELLVIAVGAGLLWLMRRRWPALPANAQSAMKRLKAGQLSTARELGAELAITMVILVAGAGVGPEAALTAAIVAASVWVADKLRYLYFDFTAWRRAPWRLLHPTAYLVPYDPEALPEKRTLKHVMMASLIINGLVVAKFLLQQWHQPQLRTVLGASDWQWQQLWVLALALGVALLYQRLDRRLQTGLAKIKLPLWGQVAAGAGFIFLVAQVEPALLFSGQHSVDWLLAMQHATPWLLTLLAVFKLIFMRLCLNFGWRGGDLFPLLFVGLTQGFALAAWLPQVDTMLTVAVTATAMMAVLGHHPALAAVMVALFCPLTLLPAIALAAAAVMLGQKLQQARTTA